VHAIAQSHTHWKTEEDVTISVYLTAPTSHQDPRSAEGQWRRRRRETLPAPDTTITICSDGPASHGTTQGGGRALIILHRANRQLEVQDPAGALCSSTRAEVMAIGLTRSAPPPQRDSRPKKGAVPRDPRKQCEIPRGPPATATRTVRLYPAPGRGCLARALTAVGVRVPTVQQCHTTLQVVPGNAGIWETRPLIESPTPPQSWTSPKCRKEVVWRDLYLVSYCVTLRVMEYESCVLCRV